MTHRFDRTTTVVLGAVAALATIALPACIAADGRPDEDVAEEAQDLKVAPLKCCRCNDGYVGPWNGEGVACENVCAMQTGHDGWSGQWVSCTKTSE